MPRRMDSILSCGPVEVGADVLDVLVFKMCRDCYWRLVGTRDITCPGMRRAVLSN